MLPLLIAFYELSIKLAISHLAFACLLMISRTIYKTQTMGTLALQRLMDSETVIKKYSGDVSSFVG